MTLLEHLTSQLFYTEVPCIVAFCGLEWNLDDGVINAMCFMHQRWASKRGDANKTQNPLISP